MDLAKVLFELHKELTNLDAAIVSLERLIETGKRERPLVLLASLKKSGKNPQPKPREKAHAATADPQ